MRLHGSLAFGLNPKPYSRPEISTESCEIEKHRYKPEGKQQRKTSCACRYIYLKPAAAPAGDPSSLSEPAAGLPSASRSSGTERAGVSAGVGVPRPLVPPYPDRAAMLRTKWTGTAMARLPSMFSPRASSSSRLLGWCRMLALLNPVFPSTKSNTARYFDRNTSRRAPMWSL